MKVKTSISFGKFHPDGEKRVWSISNMCHTAFLIQARKAVCLALQVFAAYSTEDIYYFPTLGKCESCNFYCLVISFR